MKYDNYIFFLTYCGKPHVKVINAASQMSAAKKLKEVFGEDMAVDSVVIEGEQVVEPVAPATMIFTGVAKVDS